MPGTSPITATATRFALLGLLLSGGAHAGTVYIPLPGIDTVGSTHHKTVVTITNAGTQSAKVTYLQLPTNVDGAARNGLTIKDLTVAAGKTVLLEPVGNAPGMLELSAPSGVHFSARVVATSTAVPLGDELPVLSSQTMAAAGASLVVQGIAAAANAKADAVIVNLGHSAATCSAHLERADGTTVISATLHLQPLSHVRFPNVFAGAAIKDARLQVSCDSIFFAYAQLTDAGTGELAIATPAGSSDSTLTLPAVNGLTCTAGSACFKYAGHVFTPTVAKPTLALRVQPPAKTYRAVRARLDVRVNGWHPPERAAHGVLYLVRNKNRDQFASLFLRGPSTESVTMRHGMGVPATGKAKIERRLPLETGVTYTFDYLYDMRNRRIQLRVLRGSTVVAELQDAPNVDRVDWKNNDTLIIGLSNPGTDAEHEPASIGFDYSNVLVELLP